MLNKYSGKNILNRLKIHSLKELNLQLYSMDPLKGLV